MNSCEYSNRVLLYLDNELCGEELEDFQVHTLTCRSCREQLKDEEELSGLLHRFRPLYAAPPGLRKRVAAAAARSTASPPVRTGEGSRERLYGGSRESPEGAVPSVFTWSVAAAAILVMALGLAFAPSFVQQARATAYVEAAATTHLNYLNGTLPLGIQSDSPAVVTAWFAGRVPFHFQLPAPQDTDASKPAYRLTGARLVNYRGSYAALVTYEMRQEKISLLVASDKTAIAAGGDEVRSGNLIFHNMNKENLKVITWSNHGLTYALVSSMAGSAQHPCLVCHQNMADHDLFAVHP